MIPSPAKHTQMKTTHQQIQSHLKKVDVSRFPVVSNQATQELNYVAVNKHSQNTPGSTKQWMNERLPKLVQSRHLENILKQMAPQELDKVLWIESIHWASCTRGSRNPSQNYTGCTFKFLLQRQRKVSASTTEERKAFHHWFRRREFNFYAWSRLFSFQIQNCLCLCHAWMSFRHMTSFCILIRRKGVSSSVIFKKLATETIDQNLKC